MEYVIVWVVGSVISAVLLVIAMLVVQRIADLSIPPLGQLVWRATIVSLGANAVYIGVAPFLEIAAIFLSFGAFVALMVKLFDVEFWQLLVITLATWFIRAVVLFALADVIG